MLRKSGRGVVLCKWIKWNVLDNLEITSKKSH